MDEDIDWGSVTDELLQLTMRTLGLSSRRGYAAASELRRRMTGEPLEPWPGAGAEPQVKRPEAKAARE